MNIFLKKYTDQFCYYQIGSSHLKHVTAFMLQFFHYRAAANLHKLLTIFSEIFNFFQINVFKNRMIIQKKSQDLSKFQLGMKKNAT